MASYEIPLSPNAQRFNISLNNATYILTVQWRDPAPGWVLDIADANSNPIVSGIPLVTGCDLLDQYAYLGIGGQLYVQTSYDLTAVPNYQNLGVTAHLYFVENAN